MTRVCCRVAGPASGQVCAHEGTPFARAPWTLCSRRGGARETPGMKTKEIISNNVAIKLSLENRSCTLKREMGHRNPNPAPMAGRRVLENGKSSFFKEERDFSRRNVSRETGHYNENTFCEINVPSRGRDNRPVSRPDVRSEPCDSEHVHASRGSPQGDTELSSPAKCQRALNDRG